MRRNRHEKGNKPYDRPGQTRNHSESSADEREKGSRLFRGAQAGGSRQGVTSRPHSNHQPRIFPSNASAENEGGQHVEFCLNEQTGGLQRDPMIGEAMRTIESSRANSSEPGGGDFLGVLERARKLLSTSDFTRTDKPTRGDGVHHQKQASPSNHRHTNAESPLPSSLRGRHYLHEESLPLEHRTRATDPNGDSVQPFRAQAQSPHIDDKDRLLTVRDMEHFTKAIQCTIREMTSEFIEALAEIRRSEDAFDESERE